jgi:glycosyltransferase involved in cell wall biosynthesis
LGTFSGVSRRASLLRICLVNTYHYRRGGDCTYTFDLADLLRTRGHEVIHFAMKHRENVESEYGRFFAEHIDFGQTFRSGNPFRRFRAFARSLYSGEARGKFARLLDETKPDIVHLQNFRRHLTFSVVQEAKERGLPVVFTAHDYDPICPNSLLLAKGKVCTACEGKHFYRAALARCKENSMAGSVAIALEGTFTRLRKYYGLIDVIITPSAFARDRLVESGFSPNRVKVVHNFIDTGAYEPHFRGEGVVYFGRLVVEKGLESLVRAAKALPGVKIMLAGDGPEREHLEALAEELGVKSASGNVEFLGYVDRSRLHGIVSATMCVVMPSIWYENFPYTVLEAFALGKPVVASKIGGLPEMVTDGETGLLFDPGSQEGLNEALSRLVKDPGLAEEMGRKARKRVEREFDSEAHYRRILGVYDSLV